MIRTIFLLVDIGNGLFELNKNKYNLYFTDLNTIYKNYLLN